MPGPAPHDRPTFPLSFPREIVEVLVRRPQPSRSPQYRRGLDWPSCSCENPDLVQTSLAGAVVELHPKLRYVPPPGGARWAEGEFPPWTISQGTAGEKLDFPPLRDQAVVKAIACEAVSQEPGFPLSRLSSAEPGRQGLDGPLARAQSAPARSGASLDADAIKALGGMNYWILPS